MRPKAFRSGNYPLFAGGAIFYFPDALSVAALPVPDAVGRAVVEILEPQSLCQSYRTRRPYVILSAPRPPGPAVSFYGRIWDMRYQRFRLQTSSRSPLRAAPARTSSPPAIIRRSCCERRRHWATGNGPIMVVQFRFRALARKAGIPMLLPMRTRRDSFLESRCTQHFGACDDYPERRYRLCRRFRGCAYSRTQRPRRFCAPSRRRRQPCPQDICRRKS